MLLSEHHEALEYDLLTVCGVDLLDVYRGTLSLRRLWVLVKGLPAESLTKQSVDPDTALRARWGPGEYLLADLFDAYQATHAKNPKPYPRPDDMIAKRNAAEKRRAVFDRMTS